MYIYIYIYIHTYICIYFYVYIYIYVYIYMKGKQGGKDAGVSLLSWRIHVWHTPHWHTLTWRKSMDAAKNHRDRHALSRCSHDWFMYVTCLICAHTLAGGARKKKKKWKLRKRRAIAMRCLAAHVTDSCVWHVLLALTLAGRARKYCMEAAKKKGGRDAESRCSRD